VKRRLLLAAALGFGLLALGGVLLVGGYVAYRWLAPADGAAMDRYTFAQTDSAHPGYKRNTLTHGDTVYVSDYEESSLQIATSEPQPVIGYSGAFGDSKVCAIPGQPVTAYVAGDVGSEMPAYQPYRNLKEPPFDWRTATFQKMQCTLLDRGRTVIATTNAALLAELVRNLRDDAPVELPAFPFPGVTNLTTINLACDRLPGLYFCPCVCTNASGRIYLAESLMFDLGAKPQLTARWVPASPMLAQWLKAP
jgi:hypothetical protein